MNIRLGASAAGLLLLACQAKQQIGVPMPQEPPPVEEISSAEAEAPNPPLPGFDLVGSDREAMDIADGVMARLGGRAHWDATRYITWRFFGKRRHVWDKWTGNLRFENRDLVVLMNIHSRLGRAWEDGEEIAHPDSLAAKLEAGYRAWVNDSYWVAMPYKLKDTGVTLKYKGRGMTEAGLPADVLELTFSGVGVTPENKYDVYVDIHEQLVVQWAFYRDRADSEPAFVRPWTGWSKFGEIWLAPDHGPVSHTEMAVFDELPAVVFESPEYSDLKVTAPDSGQY